MTSPSRVPPSPKKYKKQAPRARRAPPVMWALRVSHEALFDLPTYERRVASRMLFLAGYLGAPVKDVESAWWEERLVEAEKHFLAGSDEATYFRQAGALGPALLRSEVEHYTYFRDLFRALLKVQPQKLSQRRSLVYGLTAGAEVEILYSAGYTAHMAMPGGPARNLCEARLLATGTPHAPVPILDDLPQGRRRYRFMVLPHSLFGSREELPDKVKRRLQAGGTLLLPRSRVGVYDDLQGAGFRETNLSTPLLLALTYT